MTKDPRRKFLAGAGVAAAASLASSAALAQGNNDAKARVVFQVSDNDPQKWNLALNNAANVQQAREANGSEIEIVAYGPGVKMLVAESIVGNRVGDALAAGIGIVACRNTMKAMKLAEADMLPRIGYVPAGVIELIDKQRQGWAYIRP